MKRLAVLLMACIFLLPAAVLADEVAEIKTVSLGVGRNETERNITWHSNSAIPGMVQYGEKTEELFPEVFSQADALPTQATNDPGYYINRATITGLKPGTTYVYRLVQGETVSPVYSFSTLGEENFSFLFMGDPQIGASDLRIDAAKWEYMIDRITKKFPESRLLLTAGDQVDVYDNEEQYSAYFAPAVMKSLTNSTVIGNHDTSSVAYTEHFYNPNTASGDGQMFGVTEAGCDYWYTHNNVLFLHLNTNNLSTAEHKAFMEDAIAKNPNMDWKIVVFHHSLFSTAYHAIQEDIVQRRNELVPVLTELNIDMVLAGHDHIYVRTYMMNGLVPDTSQGVVSSVTNPTGILYITSNSSTGSKFYPIMRNLPIDYAAVVSQEYSPTFSNVEVTKQTLKITTYQTENMSIIDSFEIRKTSENSLFQQIASNLSTREQEEILVYIPVGLLAMLSIVVLIISCKKRTRRKREK